MFLAKVTGTVVATVKDPDFTSRKLLVIQPISSAGIPTGDPLVAVDSVGVGVGESVLFVRGKEASFPFLPDHVPTDAGIVARVDQIEVSEVR